MSRLNQPFTNVYQFWTSVIKDYTQVEFTEYTRRVAHFKDCEKNIFRFDNASKLIQ